MSTSTASPVTTAAPTRNNGMLIGVFCYIVFGTFPIYFRQLQPAGVWEQLAHRVVWVCCVLVALMTVRKNWGWIDVLRTNRRMLVRVLTAGIMLTANWSMYVWAVDHDRVVDASLGYFITPIFAVPFGVIFLKESIRRPQILAISLGAAAVAVLGAAYGNIPWVGLFLGVTFAIYGLLKKGVTLDPVSSLFVETLIFVIPAIVFIVHSLTSGSAEFAHNGLLLDLKLVGLGPFSVLPLVLFGMAAHRLPLVAIGLVHYISPCLQLLIGWGLYDEEMPPARFAGFLLIFAALVVLATDTIHRARTVRAAAVDPSSA